MKREYRVENANVHYYIKKNLKRLVARSRSKASELVEYVREFDAISTSLTKKARIEETNKCRLLLKSLLKRTREKINDKLDID